MRRFEFKCDFEAPMSFVSKALGAVEVTLLSLLKCIIIFFYNKT